MEIKSLVIFAIIGVIVIVAFILTENLSDATKKEKKDLKDCHYRPLPPPGLTVMEVDGWLVKDGHNNIFVASRKCPVYENSKILVDVRGPISGELIDDRCSRIMDKKQFLQVHITVRTKD